MKISKRAITILFLLIIFISIKLNFHEGFNSSIPTTSNLIGSIIFLLDWFIFSLYMGIKQEKKYKTFLLIYWSISFIPFLYQFLESYFPNIPPPYLSALWFGLPMFGLLYQFKISSLMFCLINPILVITFSSLGYLLGLKINKLIKIKKL